MNIREQHVKISYQLSDHLSESFKKGYRLSLDECGYITYSNMSHLVTGLCHASAFFRNDDRVLLVVDRPILRYMTYAFLGLSDDGTPPTEHTLSVLEDFMGSEISQRVVDYYKEDRVLLKKIRSAHSLSHIQGFDEQEDVILVSLAVSENGVEIGKIHFCYPRTFFGEEISNEQA
ncbi:MAG: hypothetical protein O3A01_06085 [bacterium]|nr:hypothetical protein [bacterium]